MSKISVRNLVFYGFGLVLALLAAIVTFGLMSSSQMARIFSDYRGTAKDTVALTHVIEDMYEARLASVRYRSEPSDEAAATVESNLAEVLAAESEMESRFSDEPELLGRIRSLKDLAKQYGTEFQRMRALQLERNELVEALVESGPAVRKGLTELLSWSFDDQNLEATHYSGIAQQELMLGRLYSERFLLNNDQADFERAIVQLNSAADAMSKLLGAIDNQDRLAATASVVEGLELFTATIGEVREIIYARNAIRVESLDVIGPQIEKGLDEILDRVVARQGELGDVAVDRSDATQLGLIIAAAITFVLGMIVAAVVGGHVNGRIQNVVDTMHRLAGGDESVEITGADRLAAMLRLFRDSVKKAREAIEAQEREKEALQADARRKEMFAEMIEDCSSVVGAASQGDFSRRLRSDFDDDALSALSSNVNGLLETVDGGLSHVGAVLGRVAEGDLTARMDGAHQGAFGQLQSDLNRTVELLDDMVGRINAVASVLSTNAHEITTGSSSLASRAEQQASSLEQTAATMEEMSAGVKTNAGNAERASELAVATSTRADAGGRVVDEAVSAMSDLEQGAAKIADIVSVIDGIAFQTNLLALNAAVEAARAGDAGKGFAVVASEVRALAQRSSEAARDIRELIASSQKQVADGVRLVRSTGDSLMEIVGSIKEVEQAIESITTASREQAAGVQEISVTVSHLDQITQENTGLADHSAATARTLTENAGELKNLIGFFQADARREADAA